MEKEKLELLSIFELRNLARKTGVFSPTTLKKKDLIKAICDVQTGKIKPHISKTRQGRPPKEIGAYNKLVDIFLPSDIESLPTIEETKYLETDDMLTMCNDPCLPEIIDETFLYKGFLEILSNCCGLIRTRFHENISQQDMVFVPSKEVQNRNLKSGDEIICKACKVAENRPMVLVNIISINGIAINDFESDRISFDEQLINKKTKLIEYKDDNLTGGIELKYGDTIYCYTKKDVDFDYFVSRFISSTSSCFDKTIYLAPTLVNFEYDKFKLPNVEVYASNFQDSFSTQQRIAFLSVNRAKRLAENGENVCLIIDNIVSVVGLDKNPSCELPISKHILSCAKALSRGSVTILCNFPQIPQPYLCGLIMTTFPVLETVGLTLKDKSVDSSQSYRK